MKLHAAVERHQAGDLATARALYQEVLERQPEQPDALHLLGVLRDQQGAHAEAVDLISRAIAISPGEASFHGNRGTALLALQRDDEAEESYRKALELDPAYAEGHYNLANLLRARGLVAEARGHFEQAIMLQPGHVQARSNLAMLLWEDLGEVGAAEEQYRQLLQMAPQWATARMNYGLFRLSQGQFAEGWREYEWRWRSETYEERDWSLGLPRWDGRPLGDAGLLVWGEQGVGDQILYGTMLADAQRRAGRLIVAVDERLVGLFGRSLNRPGVEVVPRGAAVSAAMQCPFGSLGAFLRQTPEDFHGSTPYLIPDPERLARIAHSYRRIAGEGRKQIGLAWRSGNRSIGRQKSIPLPLLLPHLRRADVLWVSLQYGETGDDVAWLRDQGVSIHADPDVDSLRDMDGFAAQIAALDGVLTVSNTAVHVAGALGIPTTLLLPAGRGRLWYWPERGSGTCWYRSVSILRQSQPDDWSAPLAEPLWF